MLSRFFSIFYFMLGVVKTLYTITHGGWVMHICISDLTIISSDNGLSPGRLYATIWTNTGILLIEPLGMNFSEMLIIIQASSFKKMNLKMPSTKWHLFCLSLNVLIVYYLQHHSCRGENRSSFELENWWCFNRTVHLVFQLLELCLLSV